MEYEQYYSGLDYPSSYSGLKLVNHGGKCCGVKTIHGFTEYSNSALEECAASNADANGGNVHCNKRFFHEAAPKESTEKRLDRYLDYLRRRRPQGLVEVTLNQYQTPLFEPMLLDKGFKCVTEFRNSNSTLRVKVFHLVMDELTKPTPEETREAESMWDDLENGLEYEDDDY